MYENITILGLENFDSIEKHKIMDYAKKFDDKLLRDAKGLLIVHAKKHTKGGRRVKYSFHVRLEAPEILISVQDDDWILATALHKVFEKVSNQFHHKFKTEGSNILRRK